MSQSQPNQENESNKKIKKVPTSKSISEQLRKKILSENLILMGPFLFLIKRI